MASLSQKASIIASCPLFKGVPEEEQRKLAASGQLHSLNAEVDQWLFRVGDASENLFILTEQRPASRRPLVQIQFGSLSQSSVGFRLSADDVVGDVEFLLGGMSKELPRRITTAVLLSDVTVLSIPIPELSAVAVGSHLLSSRFTRHTSRKLAEIISRQADKVFVHPEVRFARNILTQLDDLGHVAANRGIFDERLRQATLASNLGMSPRLLSMWLAAWGSRGLVSTVPFALPDVARVELIASIMPPDLADKIEQAITLIDRLIAGGLFPRACQIAGDMLVLFPGNPIVSHQLALVSARLSSLQQARSILSAAGLEWGGSLADLKERVRVAWDNSYSGLSAKIGDALEDGERAGMDATLKGRISALVTDIGALHARLLKDEVTNRRMPIPPSDLIAVAEAYRLVHEVGPNFYCAVNAATFFELAGEHNQAERLAHDALRQAARAGDSYWARASRGEASIVLGDLEQAVTSFQAARRSPDADLGKIGSTRRQLSLIAGIGHKDMAAPLAATDPGAPLFFTGQLFAASRRTAPELAEAEERLRFELTRWLSAQSVTGVYSALACGSDIVFAELALSAGIPLHVTLPFSIEEFQEHSVAIGKIVGGTDWTARYYRCLDRAADVRVIWDKAIPSADRNAHYFHCNKEMIGQVLHAAARLSTRPVMLAVAPVSAKDASELTRKTIANFNDLGGHVDCVSAPLLPSDLVRKSEKEHNPFACVVFAFSCSIQANESAAEAFTRFSFAVRRLKDRRISGYRIVQDAGTAISLARQLALAFGSESVRAVCDHGPVFARGLTVNEDAMLHLMGTGDIALALPAEPYATTSFAMSAVAAGYPPSRFAPMTVSWKSGPVLRPVRDLYAVKK
ncbi:Crp/Fnr family transcriptional regulator [Ensifer adhaerens]|uniref:Crp/Fnr family transcriptional regulator n=1 Tax=Ensifer adhaerens TaxID=106592 RepID=UPI000CF0BE9D|nr:Crp/Fnr family transcriptional regulator [Ensifer adhaerens]